MRRLIALSLLLTPVAWAQNVKLDWPRSFTGQPDFAFTREEAFADARSRAARTGGGAPQLPTILTLAADNSIPDPLRLGTKQSVAQEDGTLRTDESAASLVDVNLPTLGSLPVYATPTTPDLREFTATLAQTISSTLSSWDPDPARFDVGGVVRTLTLQAIVTSPSRYAIINGGRYSEGSSFLMRVPVAVPDMVIMDALAKELPAPGTFDEETMAAYTAAYEEALANYAKARAMQPGMGMQSLNLAVRVKEIQSRKVVVDVNGVPYDLGMRYRY